MHNHLGRETLTPARTVDLTGLWIASGPVDFSCACIADPTNLYDACLLHLRCITKKQVISLGLEAFEEGNEVLARTLSFLELARKMVCEYGMSAMGPMTYGKKEQEVFLGREIGQSRDFSDDTARQIDAEVRRFVDAGYKSAYTILESNGDIMHRMATALLERETLDASDIKLLIEGKELPAARSPLSGVDPDSGETQKVLKTDNGRKPGFGEGQPSPA